MTPAVQSEALKSPSNSSKRHKQDAAWSFASIKAKTIALIDDIDRHEIFLLSGSMAYTTALSIAPFLLIMLSIASFLPDSYQAKMYSEMSAAAGEHASQALKAIVENADKKPSLSTVSGLIGFVILAISASALFIQMRQALNKINEYTAPKNSTGFWGFIKERFFSIGLVFGFAFLLVVSLLMSTLITVVFHSGDGILWEVISTAVNLLVFTAVFSCIYRFIPSEKQPWKTCLKSGIVSSVFYLIGKSLIGAYLGKAGLGESYGAAGSLVVFLAWVFYTSLMFLVSYEFTHHFLIPQKQKDSRANLN